MIYQRIYTYLPHYYSAQGINSKDSSFFLEAIGDWELDFHQRFPFCFAEQLFANSKTMKLLHGCLELQENQKCGMPLKDGAMDSDAPQENEEHIEMVYALGSMIPGREKVHLWLIIDETILDGMVILKYMPDNNDGK